MLVLSRETDQSFRISDDIIVTVLGVNKGQVKIGIEAPRHINIVREELLESPERFSFLSWFTKKK